MPTTLLSLPIELRLRIYELILTSTPIQSFRPHRKIGWNRSPLDLSTPERLFESEAHPILRRLFVESKLTRSDHEILLQCLLTCSRVLCVTFDDFAALQRLSSASVLPSVAVGMSASARGFASIVRERLRTIDFSDKLDEIICQPNDLVKLLKGLVGLKVVCLTSKHLQRYSGTIEEHVDFAKERAAKEAKELMDPKPGISLLNQQNLSSSNAAADEFRRLRLRSPMTDGNRMLISPLGFSGTNTPSSVATSESSRSVWVVVDLSLLVWQHFLYTGAPYRDSWRTVKMQTLLDLAEKQGFDVVMKFPTVEFDPTPVSPRSRHIARGHHQRRLSSRNDSWSGTFRAEMSTTDWTLRLRHKACGLEYCIKQRKHFGTLVDQEGSGMTRCRHRRRRSSNCGQCVEETRTH